MEVLKSAFLLIKYSVPKISIERTNLPRIKSLNIKFSKYQKQSSGGALAKFIEKYQKYS